MGSGYSWVRYNGHVPAEAIRGGFHSDDTTIFVGRASHAGQMLPAKCLLEKNVAFVSYRGEEHCKKNYQILCRGKNKVRWQASSHGKVPEFAFIAGRTSYNEPLYVGRVRFKETITVGKVHPSHKCCYIPFNGKEHKLSHYEVLQLIPM